MRGAVSDARSPRFNETILHESTCVRITPLRAIDRQPTQSTGAPHKGSMQECWRVKSHPAGTAAVRLFGSRVGVCAAVRSRYTYAHIIWYGRLGSLTFATPAVGATNPTAEGNPRPTAATTAHVLIFLLVRWYVAASRQQRGRARSGQARMRGDAATASL